MRRSHSLALAILASLGVAAPLSAANYVEAIIFHDYSEITSNFGYSAEIGIHLDTPGITGVTLTRNNVVQTLDTEDANWWDRDAWYSDLDQLKADMSAEWIITVNHGSTSSMTFTTNLSSVVESSFPALPQIQYPGHNATVPTGPITLTWLSPDAADSNVRDAWLDSNELMFDTDLGPSQFTWEPGALAPGEWQFGVEYAFIPDALTRDALLTDLSTTGTLVWESSPYAVYAPDPWPTGTPMLGSASYHEISFTVVPEPSSLGMILLGAAALIRRQRAGH